MSEQEADHVEKLAPSVAAAREAEARHVKQFASAVRTARTALELAERGDLAAAAVLLDAAGQILPQQHLSWHDGGPTMMRRALSDLASAMRRVQQEAQQKGIDEAAAEAKVP